MNKFKNWFLIYLKNMAYVVKISAMLLVPVILMLWLDSFWYLLLYIPILGLLFTVSEY
jgi:hypothetical protein